MVNFKGKFRCLRRPRKLQPPDIYPSFNISEFTTPTLPAPQTLHPNSLPLHHGTTINLSETADSGHESDAEIHL